MKGLKDTLANLARLRGRFERLLSSAAKRGTGAPAASPRHRETTAFGSNPGNLRMFSHVPKGLSKAPATGTGRRLAWLHTDCRRVRPRFRLV
jgi:hypothetical protein